MFQMLILGSEGESHLYCNPNECRKLTEWLLKQAEEYQQVKKSLIVSERASVT